MSDSDRVKNGFHRAFFPFVDAFLISADYEIQDKKADDSEGWLIDQDLLVGLLFALPIPGSFLTGLGIKTGLAYTARQAFEQLTEKPDALKKARARIREVWKTLEVAGDVKKLTREEALLSGLEFAPGHPDTGEVYVRHPLARHRPEFANTCLRPGSISKILMAERTNEFIRLCVDLGATTVNVVETLDQLQGSESGANLEAPVTTPAGAVAASIGVNSSSQSKANTVRERVYQFPPKNNSLPSDFNEADYPWLQFEPDWRGLVHARIKGQCLSASVLLDNTFESYNTFGAKIGLTISETLGANLSSERKSKVADSIRFDVTFQGPSAHEDQASTASSG